VHRLRLLAIMSCHPSAPSCACPCCLFPIPADRAGSRPTAQSLATEDGDVHLVDPRPESHHIRSCPLIGLSSCLCTRILAKCHAGLARTVGVLGRFLLYLLSLLHMVLPSPPPPPQLPSPFDFSPTHPFLTSSSSTTFGRDITSSPLGQALTPSPTPRLQHFSRA